jgi:hypothetical protein
MEQQIKQMNMTPPLYILMQKAIIGLINTCRLVRQFLAKKWITNAWSVSPELFFWEPAILLNEEDDGEGNNNNNNNNNNM